MVNPQGLLCANVCSLKCRLYVYWYCRIDLSKSYKMMVPMQYPRSFSSFHDIRFTGFAKIGSFFTIFLMK
ncbi:hypothetical protein SLE2022_130240 [Rubroshorea leprosula]